MLNEPVMLAEPPPEDVPIDEGEELVPMSKVRELVAAAEKRASDAAWAAARRALKLDRDKLIAEVAVETAALLKGKSQ